MWILLNFIPNHLYISKHLHYYIFELIWNESLMVNCIFFVACRKNQDLIKELSIPVYGSKDLSFPSKYAQSFITQCMACFWKQYWSYWRNPQYNAVRFFGTLIYGVLFGTMFWNSGEKT